MAGLQLRIYEFLLKLFVSHVRKYLSKTTPPSPFNEDCALNAAAALQFNKSYSDGIFI